jgi:hypothetical protein
VSCQEADKIEIAAGWEYVIDNVLGDKAYSNTTTIGCGSLWKNADTRMTERGGCLANLGYVGTTDAIFTLQRGRTSPIRLGLKMIQMASIIMHTKSYH